MRKAASMLELVIAIVVMGIAISALPLILTQSQNSNALALQQEAIMATKAKISYILAYEWDANSYDENASVSRVLDTTSSATAHDAFDTTSTRRIGHVEADKRRRLKNLLDVDRNTSITDNRIAGTPSDIDDFDYVPDENISISNQDDYIFSLLLNPVVSYISDGNSTLNYNASSIEFNFNTTPITTNPTNIKMITVHTTGENGMNITLRAYASNIGESGILSKANW